MITPWVQTDDECWQFRRIINDSLGISDSDLMFELYQVQAVPGNWYAVVHGYVKGAEIRVREILEEYGYESLEQVKRTYGKDWLGIMAECEFELRAGNGEVPVVGGTYCKTWDEAREMIDWMMANRRDCK